MSHNCVFKNQVNRSTKNRHSFVNIEHLRINHFKLMMLKSLIPFLNTY